MEERTDALAGSPAASADHGITISTIPLPAGTPLQASCLCGWQSPVVPSRPQAVGEGDTHLVSARVGAVDACLDPPSAGSVAIPSSATHSGPSWATEHEEIEGGLRWSREAEVAIEPTFTTPGAEPASLAVVAFVTDTLTVDDDHTVRLVREERVTMYVGDGDELMTTQQARRLAETILETVNAIEGGQR